MIYLHIGYPKTGTTTLQAFLGRNRRALAKAGPQVSAVALSRARPPRHRPGAQSRAYAARERRRTVGRDGRARTRSGAGRDRRRSDNFKRNVPVRPTPTWSRRCSRRAERESLSIFASSSLHLVSAYAQRIRQLSIARRSFALLPRFDPDYLEVLDGWANVFGSDNLDVGIYDKSCFLDNDIRMDFLARLRLDPKLFDFNLGKRKQGNPTIGPELIEFKGALNALVPEIVHRESLIFDSLAAIAPRFSRLRTSVRFASIFGARFSSSNSAVQKLYLGARTFPKREMIGAPSVVDRDEAIDLA